MAKTPQLEELYNSYQAVFNTPDGQRVLEHLAHVGHLHTPTYVTGDSHETAHREGQRRIVLSILTFLNKTPQEIQRYNQEVYTDERGI